MKNKKVFSFVWNFVCLQKWTFLFIVLLDCIAWPADALVWPYLMHKVVDIFTQYETERFLAWNALQGPIWGVISLVLFVEIASRTMGFFMAKALPKLQADIRMAMFDHIQHHTPHYFNERFAGTLANKITDMTTQVELIIQNLFFPMIPAVSACVFGSIFLWFVNPLFSLLLLVWVAIHIPFGIRFTRGAEDYEHRHGEARSELLGFIVDSLTNNFAVNLFYRFKDEKRWIFRHQREEHRTNEEAMWYVEVMRCLLSFIYFSGVILGMFGPMVYMWLHSVISTGQLVQVFTTIWSLTMVMWTVSSTLPILFQSFGTLRQAYSVMEDPQDLGDIPNARELQVTKGEIVFEGVTFRYGENRLFENKHVRIQPGERVGLVGYTGAGKSTFVNLILRLFPLIDGAIRIDGQDIAQVTLESLRTQMALIPQEPILFHRTLRENILYGNPHASEESFKRAAKLAHCDEFINRIPRRYEAVVGERGTKLSGGEKQRIAIARAILANTPILLLDEATSALDSITEKCIQESLEELMHNRTTIVIAHRLSTLSHMNRILVFDQGKIVEEGNHAHLMELNGHYAKMWNMQVGGFLPVV